MATSKEACCFTGHRIIRVADRPYIVKNLRDGIVALISLGVTRFLCGGALGFDTIAAQLVLELREKYPQIKLGMFLPCRTQTEKWDKFDIDVYNDILSEADYVEYVSDDYTIDCMRKRNRRMVDLSEYCICYLRKDLSGTGSTVRYAQKKNRSIMRL
jgi:uncharacterized phage-like protein YoqJ